MGQSSSDKRNKTIVEGRSENIELLEKRKGFLEVDLPQDAPDERLEDIFNLIGNDLQEGSSEVNLDHLELSGLNNRRTEMSILASILKTAKDGSNKTRILYEANLSGRQLKNYLNFLIDSGCLEEKAHPKKSNSYITTPKGKVYLSYWARIVSLLGD